MYILYFLLLLILWWNYFGYFIVLFLLKKTRITCADAAENNKISIIVPTFNEKGIIARKIDGLKNLTYKNYEVLFPDVSNDNTQEIIKECIKGYPNFILIKCGKKGRSYQINDALTLAKGKIIVITDADGVSQDNILEVFISEFCDKKVGIVGAYVTPKTMYKDDAAFWQMQNSMRLLESAYGHCAVMIGVCYAFRKEVCNKIPEDVRADDIYISFLANIKGFKAIYSPEARAEEIRAPSNFKDLLKHKIRKGKDNIKELFRFLPLIGKMKFSWLVVYLTRLMQHVLVPFILPIFLAVSIFQKPVALILTAILLTISAEIQISIFRNIMHIQHKISIWRTLRIFILTTFIIWCAIISYIFTKEKPIISKKEL